jgi:hypothetical protein
MAKPKGAVKTGGRKAGVPNKRTAEIQRAVEESGITPLEFMLDVMRNSSDEDKRFEAAKAAAPYVHAKLSTIDATLSGANGGPMEAKLVIEYVRPNHPTP